MDTAPKLTRKDAVRRAEHLAEEHLPSWLRAANPEGRLPVLCALITAIALQLAIPVRYTLAPRWPLITMEVLLLVVLVILNPVRLTRSTQLGRYTSWALLAAITIDNTASAALLNYQIVTGRVSNNAAVLLGSGAAISITNIIAFGIWYWELDSGGPFTRRTPKRRYPDFMFPQMANPELAHPNWAPNFLDYLYVSVTNVMAFSPTDTMPLARWAKIMMTLQAMVAVSTVLLVIARAVNVLR
ncbi:MAG: hypothetical protein QOG75_7360 [Mycobacterium sp.]|jgi:hypothetical protein|nr:hypothetical protein [Mycobacterium sp.]